VTEYYYKSTMQSSVVLGLLCCLCISAMAQEAAKEAPAKPAFCKSIDCPMFTSVEKDGYSVRTYTEATRWVGTSTTSYTFWMSMGGGSSGMFNKLFKYIGGENVMGKKIAMTAPVLMDYETVSTGWFGQTKMTMWFYVTDPNSPMPTSGDLEMTTLPAGLTLAVRSFKTWGVTLPWLWGRNVDALKKAVGKGNFVETKYFTASYDGPWAFSRHNEVMIIPKPM